VIPRTLLPERLNEYQSVFDSSIRATDDHLFPHFSLHTLRPSHLPSFLKRALVS
jgi:hypothetical protein